MDGLPATTASRASAALSAERERGATRQRVLCAGASKSRRQSAGARARVSDGEQGPELCSFDIVRSIKIWFSCP